MWEDIGPRKAPPGLGLRLPRTLAQFMVLVALSGLAFTALRQQPEARTFRFAVPQALPIPLAGIDDRFVRPAPGGIDDRFIHPAPEGLDDGIIVAPGRMSRRLGATAPRGPQATPAPRVWPMPVPPRPDGRPAPRYPTPLPPRPWEPRR